jgi:hypothetical protein
MSAQYVVAVVPVGKGINYGLSDCLQPLSALINTCFPGKFNVINFFYQTEGFKNHKKKSIYQLEGTLFNNDKLRRKNARQA